MRQLTVLESEAAARKLAAYLVTERIAAHVEPDKTGHIVWVRDEDQLRKAKEILAHFSESPADPRYQAAEKSAESIRRDEERRRREQRSNVVEMRGRWGTGGGLKRRCPLVIALILVSVLVAVATNMAQTKENALFRSLKFADTPTHAVEMPDGEVIRLPQDADLWSGLKRGQVWRVLTPILLHFSIMHLVFNLWCLFDEGGQVEDRRGSLYFLLLLLALAIPSNIAQALVSGPNFGGMSGVVYGLLGYLWMKVQFDNSAGYVLSKQTVGIAMVFFALCIVKDYPPFDSFLGGLLPPIANTAHLVGLTMGLAIGYAPVLFRRK
jgi:GlpG protein